MFISRFFHSLLLALCMSSIAVQALPKERRAPNTFFTDLENQIKSIFDKLPYEVSTIWGSIENALNPNKGKTTSKPTPTPIPKPTPKTTPTKATPTKATPGKPTPGKPTPGKPTTKTTSTTARTTAKVTSHSTVKSSTTTASTSTSSTLVAVPTGTPCAGNTADDRASWCDYDISTDYYNVVPDTGVTREYWFEVSNTTAAPDGFERNALLINGSFPGPVIFADWGDTVVVHFTNNLQNNGTSLHFHGIRQNHTSEQDGVASITQCPTAPGDTYTYTWRATEYGSSWYHSHYSLQAWEGVVGGIVINGPATANYDEDMGILFLSDWSHETADALYPWAQVNGSPYLDNGLINGTNVFGEDDWANQTGSRFESTVQAGKSYRYRLVNGAIDTHFKFTIDNHTMTVIAADFVPITPYTTDVLNIGMGQRYDIIITANQEDTASDFWIRAVPQAYCSNNDHPNNIKGILHYGGSKGTPAITGYPTLPNECVDELTTNLSPYVSKEVPSAVYYDEERAVTVGLTDDGLFRWYLSGSTFDVEWQNPTLLQVLDGVTDFTNSSNAIQLSQARQWVHIVIEINIPVPHPIHLHGHDFYILAQEAATYNASTVQLNLSNPPRRDVALLPAAGYLVLAWETDNPGAWLMHCHIGWHTTEGFALQWIERYDDIPATLNDTQLENTCKKWTTYQTAVDLIQTDDGI